TLNFSGSANETSKTFTVSIVNNSTVEGNQTFSLLLTNAQGGATIVGPTNVPVTIVDDDAGVTFASPVFVVPETGGNVSLTVLRQNATGDVVRVSYVTTNVYNYVTNGGNVLTNISAGPGTNYVAVTNSLTFTNGETIKSLNIGVLHDPRVTGDLSFGVN